MKKTLEKIVIQKERKFPKEIIVGVLLALSVFLLFSPAIHHDTVYYDDAEYVGAENPQIAKGLSNDGIIWAFTTGHVANWHPLTWLSHMMDVEMFGTKPAGAHFTNIIFHALNTLLLFLVLKRMTDALWRSAFVAALFGLHPLHVESVAWISERKDLLSTFFWLLTMWAYVKYVQSLKSKVQSSSSDAGGRIQRSIPFYFLALFFFALGLMSKPMVVTLPFVLLLLDIWPLQRIQLIKKSERRAPQAPVSPKNNETSRARHSDDLNSVLLEKLPFFALTVASSIVTFIVQKEDGAVSSLAALPLSSRIENAFISYVRYIGKTLWPIDLSIIYPRQAQWPSWQVWGAILFLLGISSLAIWLLRRRPYFFTGWFWFLGTLVPVIGIVQVGSQPMADRYTYIPLIGLFIVITWVAAEFSRKAFFQKGLGFSAAIILLVCTGLTRKQIGYWKDSESLFSHAIKVTRNNTIAYDILGLYFSDQKRYDEAIALYRRTLEVNPNSFGTHISLGLALEKLGRHEEAIKHFQVAQNLKPNDAEGHNNMGFALAKMGGHDKAIDYLQTALKLKPDYAEAHNNFGISLAAIGKIKEAISHYEIALAKNPRFAEAHNNLGIALLTRGDYAAAIKHFRAASKLAPDYLEAINGLAWILATHPNPKFRDGTEAVRLATRAVNLTAGKDAGVLETLAAAYAESGDFQKALNFAQSALDLAQTNLGGEMAARLESELRMYGDNQPYRDPDMNEN